MIRVTATVVRDGQPKEIPLQQLVPGDMVKLSAGDMIPGDVRLLVGQGFVHHPGHADRRIAAGGKDRRARSAHAMSRPSSTPTSVSSAPAWKAARPRRSSSPPARRPISARWPAASPASRSETAFDRGVKKFTWLMISVHAGDGAAGFPHQRPAPSTIGRRPSSSPWPWPSA